MSDGQLSYAIIDPMNILDDHTYRITFSDSAYYTQGYYLIDITDNENSDTLINNYNVSSIYQPIVDGFKLNFQKMSN